MGSCLSCSIPKKYKNHINKYDFDDNDISTDSLINKENSLNIIYDNEIDYYEDLNSLAALISICDYVITCSNVSAHIAGRLGVKTFLIIPKFFGDIWYWNESNNQSKWYPSVKIFKQKKDRNWDEPIEEIRKILKKH